ncbi:MAG: NACHT domain-containing NTPase [Rivularia sp. (in: cyanobacteria)]
MLPHDFLTEMARKYELSPEQKETFVALFGSRSTREEVAEKLHISDSALRTRMSHVYKKFSIKGNGTGKYGRLLDLLTNEHQKLNNLAFANSEFTEKQIDELVEELRSQFYETIEKRCGTMRVLDMPQPIGLNNIYTDVNILEQITGRRRLKIANLQQNFDPTFHDFNRYGLPDVEQKRVPGLEAVKNNPKLMVIGKPGAGKTTFLKYLAIQCIRGELQANLLPIFITLKEFAETPNHPNFSEFITQTFVNNEINPAQVDNLLKQGRIFFCLDGLDEVREEDIQRVLRQIKTLFKYYNNQFVITCRIAAREYTFEEFTEVEVADFDDKQIRIFVDKWFNTKELELADKFIDQLKQNKQIKELATNPLLLTLLCLEFEDSGDFPAERAELYKRATHTLLRKWDAKRGIVREQVYKKLSVQRKEDLLSQVAFTTFKNKNYFFKQKDIERYIADYIRNLPDAKTDSNALELDSEAVLKSIEAQHGLFVERAREIYSFSHLTFHEYFTARNIVNSCNPNTLDDKALQNLASHITEFRWQEVFLMTVEMLPSADCLLLLMKKQVDRLVAEDDKLQSFLVWLNDKSCSVKSCLNFTPVRALYFDLAISINAAITNRTPNPYLDLFEEDFYPVIAIALGFSFPKSSFFNNDTYIDIELSFAFGDAPKKVHSSLFLIDEEITDILKKLETEVLDYYDTHTFSMHDGDEDSWQSKWEGNVKEISEKLRVMLVKHRNIGHDWQFNKKQEELLTKYYYVNKLLVDCLNSDSYVTPEIRSYIEETLLLPIKEIEKRKLTD